MELIVNQQRNGEGVLSGYRVLDLADEKGMLCSKLLADMGADVIKVEKPGGDSARSLSFWEANVGKFGITLNLEVKQGREIFKKLVKTVDVVVESYQPQYLETLGLGYSQLSEINPQLIMTSITDFGQSGPYRDYKSCDMVACALGGQMYVCGEPETPPLKPLVPRLIILPVCLPLSAFCWRYGIGIPQAGGSTLIFRCRNVLQRALTMSWCAIFMKGW